MARLRGEGVPVPALAILATEDSAVVAREDDHRLRAEPIRLVPDASRRRAVQASTRLGSSFVLRSNARVVRDERAVGEVPRQLPKPVIGEPMRKMETSSAEPPRRTS
jgi:hypothetical protein